MNKPDKQEKSLEDRIYLPVMNPNKAIIEIGDFIVNQIVSAGYKGGVIGLSGGVDSTVAAHIAKKGFDRYNAKHPDKPLHLTGYILPSSTNNEKNTKDAVAVAEGLGIDYHIQSIEPIIKAYEITNPKVMKNPFCKGNMMAEIRANFLHGEAGEQKKLVIGTGNKDEDFNLAYYTLFGDGAVHMSPLGNLSKRLVRQIAKHQGYYEIAGKVSTAGLEPGQTDFKDLGYNYDLAELVMEGKTQGFTWEQLAQHKQVAKVAKRDRENYATIYGASKFRTTKQMVENIKCRHYVAGKKAEIVHPPIAPVTLIYLTFLPREEKTWS
ncbi:MAG: NAD(+) synthase [Nanoarchaeota archaeon]|nr:NAD(+) synthase [Nanoarchaeota archaeon]MBU1322227.1 NAD(+) synthase [Nanoarchaeota archaeon]MBU1597768.1 NAD(+) synthase [Nanoarchaeota archaeon]MBU2442032.1 NAD(+) synthase [Nanoarchaeota archaeon]